MVPVVLEPARSSLSDPALATKALDRVRVRLYYSAQPKKYKRVPISKVYPPTVVAHDLMCPMRLARFDYTIQARDGETYEDLKELIGFG
ncbi:Protein of unknown function [Cotesia congregata]|uniref:Uncharacterized protein n=1 Tax=Cotesia congregata TaxID=51543 RepID=A0A8J2HA57_COTCN|nr:Protein of unknown function [Cotesia congregata]